MAASAPKDSKNRTQNTIIQFATKILRPVVRTLLRYGLSCDELQEVCCWLYVDEAMTRHGFLDEGEAAESHVAIITGLPQKAVAHYRGYPTPETLIGETPSNRVSWLQNGWLKNPRYTDAYGAPLAIPFTASTGPSFTNLVSDYSNDVTPRTMLSELERVGAVEVQGDLIRLTKSSYLPADEDEMLNIASTSASDLLTTIHHNLEVKARDRYFQRELYYPLVPAERVGEVKRALMARLKPLMDELYNDILRYGDPEPRADRKYRRVGIGAYYFQ